jgi:4-carboxymuconolactone decarboxylase
MPRIAELKPADMTPAQRAIAEELTSGPHGGIRGPHGIWLRVPELARRARALSEFIRFQSSLPKRLLELAILVGGRFWKADYEFYAHAKLGQQAGLDEAIIRAIAERRRPTFSEPNDAVVYDLCSELLETRRVSDAAYNKAVKALGLQAVIEVVATIGYYSLVSLTLNAFAVPLPAGEKSPFPDK